MTAPTERALAIGTNFARRGCQDLLAILSTSLLDLPKPSSKDLSAVERGGGVMAAYGSRGA